MVPVGVLVGIEVFVGCVVEVLMGADNSSSACLSICRADAEQATKNKLTTIPNKTRDILPPLPKDHFTSWFPKTPKTEANTTGHISTLTSEPATLPAITPTPMFRTLAFHCLQPRADAPHSPFRNPIIRPTASGCPQAAWWWQWCWNFYRDGRRVSGKRAERCASHDRPNPGWLGNMDR